MPAGAVYVGRPTRWGNPFPLTGEWIVWAAIAAGFSADAEGRRAAALWYYRRWLSGAPLDPSVAPASPRGRDVVEYADGSSATVDECVRGIGTMMAAIDPLVLPGPAPAIAAIRTALAGRDLACWCPLDAACHADVLLEIANEMPEV